MEWLVRFAIGGAMVSLFALAGDVLRPKGFAGLFGAAPSVALATLALMMHGEGAPYAALEARSMLLGAIAFFFYACVCVFLMSRRHLKAGLASTAALVVWAGIALSLRFSVFY